MEEGQGARSGRFLPCLPLTHSLCLIDAERVLSSSGSGILALWYDMNDMERGAVVGGSILLFIILISTCHAHQSDRRRANARNVSL